MAEVIEEEAPPVLTQEDIDRHNRMLATVAEDVALAQKLAAEPDAEEKARQARIAIGTPVGFAMQILGLKLYLWQRIVLTWFENTFSRIKGSLCTPNGAGKSERVVATIALWWISAHPQGVVVITSKDSKQLDNQIWRAIEAHKGKFPGYDFIERTVRNRKGGFIIGFTTDDPGRAEGWHKINDTTGPLLLIEDEAKSITDGIDMAFDRCTYNAKLVTSSPGLTEGFFYRSQKQNAGELYNAKGFVADGPGNKRLGYKAMKVGLLDCPHIPKERIDDIVETYGPDHWYTLSTLHGEFTDADSDTLFVIPKHIVRHVMDNPPNYVPGGLRASCDFAAGRNENVFTLKQGNRIIQHCWKDPDPMRAVYQFVIYFNQYGLLPSEIYGDAGGMGIPIIKRFKELGWPINAVNNESKPIDPIRYPNLGAEMWHNAAPRLGRYDLILPNDPVLFEQLTMRRAAPTPKAILGLESKRDMKKRDVPSPDRADGLVMVLAAEVELANTVFDANGLSNMEKAARAAGRVEMGNLELGGDRIVYTKRLDGWLSVFEKPIVGFEYLAVLNPRRHNEPLVEHTLIVMRAPRYDEREDKTHPARLAARVNLMPFRLDALPLASMARTLTQWYGNCMLVPIVNDRGDIIEALEEENVHIYSREEFELLNIGRKQSFELGWETTPFTQSLWIGALSEHIREDTIVVEDVSVVMQLFTLNPNDASSMRDAEAVGVAMKLMNYATTFIAPERYRSGEIEVEASMYG